MWVPILSNDSEKSVLDATKTVKDARARQFWDGKGALVEAYSKVLEIDQPAWDVYLVYDRDAEWKEQPPVPSYWMHQLNLEPERRLNGDKLAEEANKLLSEPQK